MALRTTCICGDKIIGIESIFTVTNGMRINIPEKVEMLRKKSQNNELFCPCGCGANLTLVAGDRNLREQHFRIKVGSKETDCSYVSEGWKSVYSKIVLKCWLDDKLQKAKIESRVPISDVEDTNRHYELTLLDREAAIAVSYCRNRANLSDEKLDVLERNTSGIRIHYIEDDSNRGDSVQYPEMMMKVQLRQGYCLYLSIPENQEMEKHYAQSRLAVVYYLKTESGCWQELLVTSEPLSEYSFDSDGTLLCKQISVSELAEQKTWQYQVELEERKRAWGKKQEELRAQKEARQELLKQQELRRLQEEEQRRKRQEVWQEARQQEWANHHEQQMILQEEQRKETKRKEAEQTALEKAQIECTRDRIETIIDNNQEEPFIDLLGKRWVRCEYCGKVAPEGEFGSYGGENHANLGKCNECYRNGKGDILQKYIQHSHSEKSTGIRAAVSEVTVCPECGGKLKLRNGRFGDFWGCENYPKCRFTKNVKR